ncbi:hypothetical protein BD289DRAFT_122894 [Coniella lustricola]|uniref:Secreted protein n=1 Tax=Coniella lustricola TaxID=2025994 RepID=A0A2T2ZWI1_9PEZI|nr:hypothetical protein BD289DRAFT_122894 [Coniella lustricola]
MAANRLRRLRLLSISLYLSISVFPGPSEQPRWLAPAFNNQLLSFVAAACRRDATVLSKVEAGKTKNMFKPRVALPCHYHSLTHLLRATFNSAVQVLY